MSCVSVTVTETVDCGVEPVAAVVSSGLPLGSADAGRGLIDGQRNAAQQCRLPGRDTVSVVAMRTP